MERKDKTHRGGNKLECVVQNLGEDLGRRGRNCVLGDVTSSGSVGHDSGLPVDLKGDGGF